MKGEDQVNECYSKIVCPYCLASQRLEAHDVDWMDGNVEDRECGECGKSFWIETCAKYHWVTKVIGED